MILLEKAFKSGVDANSADPHWFEQVKRNETVAIYKRSAKSTGSLVGYEVFRIKIEKKGKNIFGTILEEDREHYPTTEADFGRSAWFVVSLERAEEIFERLTKEAAEPEEKEKEISIPVGEFSTTEFAEKTGIQYPIASVFIRNAVTEGRIKFIREEQRSDRGKKTKIYAKA